MQAGVRSRDRGGQHLVAGAVGKAVEVDLRTRGVQVEMACGELGELREPSGQRQAVDRMARKVLQGRAGEVAHVQQRAVGQPVALPRRPLDVSPVAAITWPCPAACATSMPRWIEAIQAEQE